MAEDDEPLIYRPPCPGEPPPNWREAFRMILGMVAVLMVFVAVLTLAVR